MAVHGWARYVGACLLLWCIAVVVDGALYNSAMANSDFASLLPETEPEHRRAHMTRLAMGFAAAVLPIGGQTITTDANGLNAGEVQIPTSDGIQIPAYRACPARGSNFPVVL